jgi:glycerol uptake facilitator-like aquaporin
VHLGDATRHRFLLWGGTDASIHFGVTHPGDGLSGLAALGVECLMTAILLGVIIASVSRRRLRHWTPLAAWVVVTILVWQGATHTGTSLNPARSTGPAIIALDDTDLWGYFAGPLLAAVAVAGTVRLVPAWRPLTARLFNDVRYPTTMGTAVGRAVDGEVAGVVRRGG